MKVSEPIKFVIGLFVLAGIFKDFAFDNAACYSFWCAIGLNIIVFLAKVPDLDKKE